MPLRDAHMRCPVCGEDVTLPTQLQAYRGTTTHSGQHLLTVDTGPMLDHLDEHQPNG